MSERDPRTVCGEIAADMEADATNFDGKPFNGRTVAEYFGNQGAAIAALALIVRELLGQATPEKSAVERRIERDQIEDTRTRA